MAATTEVAAEIPFIGEERGDHCQRWNGWLLGLHLQPLAWLQLMMAGGECGF